MAVRTSPGEVTFVFRKLIVARTIKKDGSQDRCVAWQFNAMFRTDIALALKKKGNTSAIIVFVRIRFIPLYCDPALNITILQKSFHFFCVGLLADGAFEISRIHLYLAAYSRSLRQGKRKLFYCLLVLREAYENAHITDDPAVIVKNRAAPAWLTKLLAQFSAREIHAETER